MDKSTRANGSNADLYATIILPEQVVTIPQETEINWQELIKLLTGIIYWSGVLLLTARFFLQLGSIMRLHFQCSKSQLKGVRVHLLKKEAGPFSFFIGYSYTHSHIPTLKLVR